LRATPLHETRTASPALIVVVLTEMLGPASAAASSAESRSIMHGLNGLRDESRRRDESSSIALRTGCVMRAGDVGEKNMAV